MVKLPIEYSDNPVTPFAGMALMKRLIDQTGIWGHPATLNLPQGGSNRAYDPVQVIESFWLGIWTGASRYIHCDWLRPGNTAACSNCGEFMRETLDEAMAGMKVGLVRGDSGFDTDERWSALAERASTTSSPREPRRTSRTLLFDDLPDYRFSLYVTNLDLPLDQIWKIYNTILTI